MDRWLACGILGAPLPLHTAFTTVSSNRRPVSGASARDTLDRRDFLREGSAAALAFTLPSQRGDGSEEPTGRPNADGLRIQRLSWAGVKLESANRTLLIDPFVSSSIWGPAWNRPIVPVEVKTTARTVLITHMHNDHFDPAALTPVLAERGVVVAHVDIAHRVAAGGFRVTPAKMFEPVPAGDFMVFPVPAVDGVNDNQVSWVIVHGDRRYIHCGDTVWHGGFNRVGRTYGPFDVAFLPINGAKVLAIQPQPHVEMSMNPEAAIGAALMLRARRVVPIHYGFHDPKGYLETPNAETRVVSSGRERGVRVDLLREGEWLPEIPAR